MNTIIIPAYNPDIKLQTLILNLKKYPNTNIIVVDDGSNIESQTIFQHIEPYVTLLHHDQNKGKGQALKTAMRYVKEHKVNGTFVTCDADGQHSPEDIFNISKVASAHPFSLVTGIRKFDKNVPLRSKIGNILTKYIYFFSTGTLLNDTQCGLRAFSDRLLDSLIEVEGDRFEYEMNMLLQGIPLETMPIETIYIDHNKSSHFKIKDGLIIYKQIFRFSFTSIISFFVDYILFLCLFQLSWPLTNAIRIAFSSLAARLCSATLNYNLNKTIVFKKSHQHSALQYAILAITIICINTAMIELLYAFNIHHIAWIKLFVEAILFIVSWQIQKHTIFKPKGKLNYENTH